MGDGYGAVGCLVALVERRLPERTMLTTLAGQAFVSIGFMPSCCSPRTLCPAQHGAARGQWPQSAVAGPGPRLPPADALRRLCPAVGGLFLCHRRAGHAREVGPAFARAMRPWVLGSWIFLTMGITAGSYWAWPRARLGWLVVLGPVENASLMPWLAATALLIRRACWPRQRRCAPGR